MKTETTERDECKEFAVVIPLTRGMIARVDLEDYAQLSKFKWQAWQKNERTPWYAKRTTRTPDGPRTVWMHRLILGLGFTGPRVDHRNRDGLDNRRVNLRCATKAQNAANTPKRSASRLYKGVRFVGVPGVPRSAVVGCGNH